MRQDSTDPRFALVIPARYESTRFPGKPLVKICGEPMIKRVWRKCTQAVGTQSVYVATDDERIASYCASEKIQVIKTSSDCLTGTDRVYEASLILDADIIVNVQGDEPLINPQDILDVLNASKKNPHQIINAMCEIKEEADFFNASVPKIVTRKNGKLLYMSRAAIPTSKSLTFSKAYKQVCIYSFPRESLSDFASQEQKTPLESIEDIEILRFLELGYDVQMIEVSSAAIAVDFPEDVDRVEGIINAEN